MGKSLFFFCQSKNIDLLVISRCGDHISSQPKKVLGSLEKICSDVGLALFQSGQLISPWIHNTDGDARVPHDYFLQTEPLNTNSHSAAIYRFRHDYGEHSNESHWQAAQLYEVWLRYYRMGLAYADSLTHITR